ncbi:MAG TPA: PAS domain S-box protein [Steroidobacteraceae bacterium]|nr:PAS domain S-box protein [Steroidobacteraceae bacterium]
MSANVLQAVMEAALEAIVLIDRHGIITGFNRSAERLFGYPAAEVLGRNVSVLMAEPYRSSHDDYIARYETTRIPHIIGVGREVEARRKDGSLFPAFLSVGEIAGEGPHRYVGMIRDMTIERQARAALEAARDQAEARRAEAQAARQLQDRLTHVSRMATLGEMAAGLAHELNQPLSAIATYARACDRFLSSAEPDLEETRSSVREIANEALRAGDIIRRLRQIMGGRAGDQVPSDVSALVDDLVVLAEADARVHKTQVEFELTRGLPPVSANHAQLQQLILGLVRNAVEALSASGAADRRVTVRTGRHLDSQVEISVSDNGPGVAPEISNRLFAPFVTTKPFGTGLGLSIGQTIARAHGGTIGYRPVEPTGACFYVRLPIIEGVK